MGDNDVKRLILLLLSSLAFHDFSYNNDDDDNFSSSASLAFHDFSYNDGDDNNNNSLMEICEVSFFFFFAVCLLWGVFCFGVVVTLSLLLLLLL